MGKNRILVVDDDRSIREMMVHMVEKAGFASAMAPDGFEALELLEGQDFDILLTDLSMPGMDGLELARRARVLSPDLVCIMLTAYGTREHTLNALKLGFFDFIEKPVSDLESLTMSLRRAGERAEILRERRNLLSKLRERNSELDANLKELKKAYSQLEMHDRVLQADLRGAQRVQQSLLPGQLPQDVIGLDTQAFYQPCEMLGGDFFDALGLGNGRHLFYLADVAGHGVRAAMITVIMHEIAHMYASPRGEREHFSDPACALMLLNNALREEAFEFPVHVTMSLAVYDENQGTLSLANAGHCPIFLVSAKGEPIRRVESSGPGLGLEATPSYETVTWDWQEGDSFVMLSDGMTEALDKDGCQLGCDALEGAIDQVREHEAREINLALVSRWQEFIPEGAALSDDVSCLVVRRGIAKEVDPAHSVTIHAATSASVPQADTDNFVNAGWTKDALIVAPHGRLTWQHAPLLVSLFDQARASHREKIYMALDQCCSVDSTILGLLHQHAAALTVCSPSEPVAAALRELGIDKRMTIVQTQPPEATLVPQMPINLNATANARLMLATHESLSRLSEENSKRFSPVIDALRREVKE